jgi:hypothetical protein
MSDGHVETYVRLVEQPHPQCVAAIKILQNMSREGYIPKHEKK